MTIKVSASVTALLDAPYGHEVSRDVGGNSRVTLIHTKGRTLTVVRATFDEAVGAALAQADAQWGCSAVIIAPTRVGGGGPVAQDGAP